MYVLFFYIFHLYLIVLWTGMFVNSDSTSLGNLKHYNTFLYAHFKDYELYKEMLSCFNQQGQLYGTAETHKYVNTYYY